MIDNTEYNTEYNTEQENIIINYDNKKNTPLSLKIICGLTGFFFFIELIIGIYTKSLALQADALHMASDFISLLVAIYSQRVSNYKPNEIYTYGYKRVEVIGGFANAVFLLSSCLFIILESIHKFIELYNGTIIIENIASLVIVGFIGLLINIIGIIGLHFCSNDEHIHSQNIKGVFLHLLGDLLGSIGVICSAFIMYYWENLGGNINSKYKYISDPISGLFIVILILYSTIKLLKECLHILLDGVPTDIDLPTLKTELLELEGIEDLDKIHLWQLNNDNIIFSSHITNNVNYELKNIMTNIKTVLDKYRINYYTIQPNIICN